MDEVHGLFGGESGVANKLKMIKNLLSQISEMDQSFNKSSNDVSDIYYQLEDIYYEISSKEGQYHYDSAKLDALIERSELIEKLKRKYGGSISSINEYLKKAKSELDLITFSTQESEKLLKNLGKEKSWKEYIDYMVAHPEITQLNAIFQRNEGYQKSINND